MLESLQFTIRIMKKRPLRSLLTILQLSLGVWIVAIILSLNFQANQSLAKVNETLGESLAKISISRVEDSEYGRRVSTANTLRLDDLDRLLESDYIDDAFIYQSRWERDIIVNDLAYRVSNMGEASASFAQAIGLNMVEGYFFTAADQEQQSRVVVISEAISKQLFPNQSAIGQVISLGRVRENTREYSVIGVYEKPSPYLEFFLPESYLIFPLGYEGRFGGYGPGYSELFIKAKQGKVYDAVADANVLLADRIVDELEVRGEYFKDSNRFLTEQIRTITLFLGAFAFISILISAIGILSIMLVSVVERTREIGLRKALGASKGVIVLQILNESVVISLLGALVGLIGAYFSAESLVSLLVQEITYPKLTNIGGLHPQAALIGIGLALMVGLIFGLYPAWQGAKLTPVDALRDS